MSVINLKIVFPNNPGNIQFFSGQNVEGCVKFGVTGKPLKTKGVKVTFFGNASVSWTERIDRSHYVDSVEDDGGDIHVIERNEEEVERFSNQEVYFNYKSYVYGNGRDESSLDPGEHSFPFSYQLPHGIPSSFEGEHGNVRYYVEAAIDKPFLKQLLSFKPLQTDKVAQSFQVIGILDVNRDPQAAVAKTAENSKNFCCLCCKHGPLSTRISLSKGGFVPGDSILVNGEINNMSKKEISNTHIVLIQRVSFVSSRKTKNVEKIIFRHDFQSVPPGESDGFKDFEIAVPALPPSRLAGCKIIGITYELKYVAIPSGIGKKLIASTPIIIGTVPAREMSTNFVPGEFGGSQGVQGLTTDPFPKTQFGWM